MVFVTVGYQMPFDRLIRTVDQWAGRSGRLDIFAQIGRTDFMATNLRWRPFLSPEEFESKIREADVVVTHAGKGSIISAVELGKPILVMPRRGDLKETRNDHQVATAKRFLEQGRIMVAFDEKELLEKLDSLDGLRGKLPIGSQASPQLIETIETVAALPVYVEDLSCPEPMK